MLSLECDKRGTHLRVRKVTTLVRRATRPVLGAVCGLLLAATARALDLRPLRDTDVYQFTGNPTSSADDLDLAFNSSVLLGAGEAHNMRSFLFFDLAALVPAGILDSGDVTSATLWLYTEAVSTPGPITVRELSADWALPGIDWDNQPAVGTFETTESVTTAGAWYSFNVTSLIQDWVDTPSSNHGLRLSAETAGNLKFESVDDVNTAVRPYLQVVPEPSTAALGGLGALFLARRRQRAR
jgi:hypothetical protein